MKTTPEITKGQALSARILILSLGMASGVLAVVLARDESIPGPVVAVLASIAVLLLVVGMFAARKVAWWAARILMGG